MARMAGGHLGVEVSSESAMAAGTMTTFIQHHLASILQPFADHVDELHKAVDQLNADLVETASRTSDNTLELTNHGDLIRSLRACADGTAQQLARHVAATQEGLEAVGARQTQLEAESQKAALGISALDGQHRDTLGLVQELRQDAKGTCHAIGQLKADLANADQSMVNKLDASVEQLRSELASLGQMHQATLKSLSAVERVGENTRADLQKCIQACERQRRKDETSFQHVSTSISNLETTLRNSDHRAKAQNDRLSTATTNVSTLQTRLEQTMRAQTVVECQQKDTNAQLMTLHEQLRGQKAAVDDLAANVGLGEDGLKMGRIADVITDLKETVSKDGASIKDLYQVTQNHAMDIETGHLRAASLEDGAAVIHDIIGQLESRMVVRIVELEGLLHENEASDQDAKSQLESDRAWARKFQAEAVARWDAQSQELARTGSLLSKTSDRLDGTEQSVQRLDRGHAAMAEQMAKLGGCLDLNQEYWTGLTKGFRETHRSVAVDNEMLPPKGSHSRTLPALTKTVPM